MPSVSRIVPFVPLMMALAACHPAARPAAATPSKPAVVSVRAPSTPGLAADLVVQTAHSDTIDAVAVSPDGALAATAGRDKLVVVWNLAAGMIARRLAGHTGEVTSVAWSPDGRALATGGGFGDGTVRVWDVASGKTVRTVGGGGGDDDAVQAIAYTPDGATLVTGHADGKVRAWNATTGAPLRTIAAHTHKVRALAISKDGKYVASGSEYSECEIAVWDLASGDRVSTMQGSRDSIASLAFDAAGDTLVSGTSGFYDKSVRVWDVKTGDARAELEGHAGAAELVLVSADGARVTSVGRDHTLRLWDVASARQTAAFDLDPEGASAAAFAPDGRTVITASGMHALRTWVTATGARAGEIRAAETSDVNVVAFAPDGATIYSAGGHLFDREDLPVRAWNGHTGAIARTLPGRKSPITSMSASPDGRLLLEVDEDGHGVVVDVQAQREVKSFESGPGLGSALGWSPDAKRFLSRAPRGDGTGESVVVSDLASGGALTLADDDRVGAAAMSPDGARVAVAEGDVFARPSAITIWNLATRKAERTLEGHRAGISAVAWSKDGRALASADFSGEVRVWSADADAPARVLGRHEPAARAVAFSPDGATLASSGDDRVVRVWDLASGRQRFALAGHDASVYSIAFSPDGARLVAGGHDGAITVWDAASGALLATMIGVGPADYVTFSKDHHYTASRGARGAVAFRVGDRSFPFEQFDLWLDRPDLVMQALGASPDDIALAAAEHARRMEKMGVREDAFAGGADVPEVSVDTRTIPPATRDARVTFTVRAKDAAAPLDRFRVYVDDVPAFGMRGVAIAGAPHEASAPVTIELGRGDNKVQVSAVNANGSESLATTFHVTRDAPARAPDVYVAAIGVNRYTFGHGAKDLAFAAKDAADVVAAYQSLAESGRFGAVHALLLRDEQATREGLAAVRAHFAKASVDDVVVLFVAGHGLVASDHVYYFATHDIDPYHPAARGVRFDDFEDVLDAVRARQKLLLMDTCFSGEVDERTAAKGSAGGGDRAFVLDVGGQKTSVAITIDRQHDLFADLRRDTGAAVVSSSTGSETSRESPAWGNGAFTFALLKGLRGGAADADGDGAVSVSELEAYVAREVPALTSDEQHPTMRRENLDHDFSAFAVAGAASIRAAQVVVLRGHRDWVNGAALSADGKIAVSASGDRSARVWDLASGTELRTRDAQGAQLTSAALTRDGRVAATGGVNGSVELWETASGRRVGALTASGVVTGVAFSPEGTRLAAASSDGHVRVWSVESGKVEFDLSGPDSALSVAFSPDGARLAAGGHDGSVRVWRTSDGALVWTKSEHTASVSALAFAPDGARLASGGFDGKVRVWDAASGAVVRAIDADARFVEALAWSADGRWLASGGADRAIHMLDPEGGRDVRRLEGHAGILRALAFAADGAHLLSASEDATLRWWTLAGGR